MTSPLAVAIAPRGREAAIGVKIALLAAILLVEAVVHTLLVQSMSQIVTSTAAQAIQDAEHAGFRLVVAYVVFCAILMGSTTPAGTPRSIPQQLAGALSAPRPSWLVIHGGAFAALLLLSYRLHSDGSSAVGLELGVAWLFAAVLALGALLASLAPYAVWRAAARTHRDVLRRAVLPAVATLVALSVSQALWRPTARATFHLVAVMLRPLAPGFTMDPASMTLGTDRFLVTIADACSGLEGMGLMLVFCVSWLWIFRREYYFPRALSIVPAAVGLMFVLNSVRLAMLVLIGDAGYPNVAIVGFHSQAGWIAFNGVAFGVAWLAKRSTWLNRTAGAHGAAIDRNPTASHLVPLLAILAAGMLAHALSAGFDYLYPLRPLAGLAALIFYRRAVGRISWAVSWRAPVVGAAVFAVWWTWAAYLQTAAPQPPALAQASPLVRSLWIACRAAGAVAIVPIAEELAYRGYLMRILASRRFDGLPLAAVGWPALVGSSLVFGASHGAFWVPGILAGLAFGYLAIRTNSLGEAICAHAVTNGLVAALVLYGGQWQLW